MKPELHLIVLWANARYKEQEIVDDIKQRLDIMAAYDMHWSCDLVSSNFTRFYGVNLPKNSPKEQECGVTGFLLLVVRDNNPKYEYVETSRGTEKVNINIFSLKQKYRQWTRGGHKIHTTNSVAETNHDSALLLGLNYDDLKKSLSKKWNGEIKTVYRDLTGAKGWTSLKEFFYTLNATINYTVLRNAEILPNKFKTDLHGDIDILTTDFKQILFITNATKVFDEPYRVHCETKIAGVPVRFDFRYVGDDYYCKDFEQDLLKHKYINAKGVSVLADEDLFYAMVYHALVHKRVVAPDYYDKIYDLFVKLGFDKSYDIKKYASPFDLYFELLEKFMANNHYQYTRPIDRSVFFNEKLTIWRGVCDYLANQFYFTNIRPIYCDKVARTGINLFLLATDEYGKDVFIKSSDIPEFISNEYKKSIILYNIDHTHFVKPLYYHDNQLTTNDIRFVASEYRRADTLSHLMETTTVTPKQRSAMLDDICDIYMALSQSDVVHRDIRPDNLMYYKNHLILIDFQLAVSKSNYKELQFLMRHTKYLKGLGTSDFRPKQYLWDDAYSLLKVVEYIGRHSSYGKKYDDLHKLLAGAVGKQQIRFKPKRANKGLKRLWKHIRKLKF